MPVEIDIVLPHSFMGMDLAIWQIHFLNEEILYMLIFNIDWKNLPQL